MTTHMLALYSLALQSPTNGATPGPPRRQDQ
jgi:hypothetical protein